MSASDGTGLKDTDTGPTVGREWKGLEDLQGLGASGAWQPWLGAQQPPRARSEISQAFSSPSLGQLCKFWKVQAPYPAYSLILGFHSSPASQLQATVRGGENTRTCLTKKLGLTDKASIFWSEARSSPDRAGDGK